MPSIKHNCTPAATAEHQRCAQPSWSASDDDYVKDRRWMRPLLLPAQNGALHHIAQGAKRLIHCDKEAAKNMCIKTCDRLRVERRIDFTYMNWKHRSHIGCK